MSPLVPGMSGVWVPPVATIASLLPSLVRKDGMPLCQVQLKVGKKERVAHLVTYTGVVLIASLLAVTRILGCPASLLTANLSHFIPPCSIMIQGVVG